MNQSLILILAGPDMNPSDVEVIGTSPDSVTITWRVKHLWFDFIQWSAIKKIKVPKWGFNSSVIEEQFCVP